MKRSLEETVFVSKKSKVETELMKEIESHFTSNKKKNINNLDPTYLSTLADTLKMRGTTTAIVLEVETEFRLRCDELVRIASNERVQCEELKNKYEIKDEELRIAENFIQQSDQELEYALNACTFLMQCATTIKKQREYQKKKELVKFTEILKDKIAGI
jgi:hypothetical protein